MNKPEVEKLIDKLKVMKEQKSLFGEGFKEGFREGLEKLLEEFLEAKSPQQTYHRLTSKIEMLKIIELIIKDCEPALPCPKDFGQEYHNGAKEQNKYWLEHLRDFVRRSNLIK